MHPKLDPSFPPLLTCTDAPNNSRRTPSSSPTASSEGHKPRGLTGEGRGWKQEGVVGEST